jgi:nitric oxide reductase NorD protein
MNEFIQFNSRVRSVELYLRALWGKGFGLQCVVSEQEYSPSYLIGTDIYLPAQIPLTLSDQYYRAAATHAALHHIYGRVPFEKSNLNLMQRTMIGLVEDLRVELLAIREFPGLGKLWIGFHDLQSGQAVSAQNLLLRLSLSVLDPQYQDDHLWVKKGKNLILDETGRVEQLNFSIDVGLQLANDMGQMRLPVNSGKYEQSVSYRDDNRCLWQECIDNPQPGETTHLSKEKMANQNRVSESDQGRQIKLSDNDAAGEGFYILRQAEADFEYRQQQSMQPKDKLYYPEWDYRTQILKQKWCTVYESRCSTGSIDKVNSIFESHKIVLHRLRLIAIRLRTEKLQRKRKLEFGDELDFDPMINAMVAMRLEKMPDMRVFVQNQYRQSKSLAILILLDLSESTNELVAGAHASISNLIRDAVLLLGDTLSIADEKFAIYGFSSNGRHEVNINNYKNFNESFDESKARLSDISGIHSTRLGTAIRYSGYQLSKQEDMRKLLLVITDGAPSDVDVYDRNYLEKESRHAVHTLKESGTKSFCINLNIVADPVIEHIFGKGRFETLDRLDRLPAVMFFLFLKHMRHWYQ